MTATIEAHGLVKRYGKTRALAGLDLVAEPGQVLAVLGPNGAGKTTFVRALATLLRLDAGALRVFGHDVRREPVMVRRLLGLAGQFAAVEPAMTGRENLEMVARLYGQGRRTARASAQRVLEQLSLVEPADRLVRTYSGGMRRRLDLGASLVGQPRLLLLDEPTTGLDPAQPDRALGRDPGSRRVGHRRAAHDPVPGRGRPAREPDRHHRSRPHDRRGDAGRAQAPCRRAPSSTCTRTAATTWPRSPRRSAGSSAAEAQIDEATRRVTIGVDGSGDRLVAALRSLDAAGIEIDDVALRQPTLDEVFLALTGRSTADDEAVAA